MKYIPELTGLRALAALMVFAGHASKDGLLPEFLGISYSMQGVFLFFVLSGYLLGQLYLNREFNTTSLKNYLSARAGRVFPLYLLIVIAAFIISNFIYNDFHYDFRDPVKFLLAIFFINTPHELWTVPIEVQFYACFILFWFFYSKEKKNLFILIALPFLILLPSIIFLKLYHRIPHVMPTYSLFFFTGVLFSILKSKGKLEIIKNKIPSLFSWLILLLFILNLSGIRKLMGVTDTHASHNIYSLVILAIFFVMVISKPDDFILLRLKPVIFIGEISYGFYLIHRPIMKIFLINDWPSSVIILSSFAATILISYILFKTLEVPSRKFITRKSDTIKV